MALSGQWERYQKNGFKGYKIMKTINEGMAALGYFTVILIAILAVTGHFHSYGTGPFGLGRLFCIY